MPQFDAKIFNGEVFGKYVDTVPNLKRNELIKSGALRRRSDLSTMFSAQTGSFYGTIPMLGLIDGDPVNYDGETDITSTSTKTFSQSVIVTGRAKAWTEKDFSEDITGGQDFMANVANQVAAYWDDIDQRTLLAVLQGIFSMTGAKNLEFVNNHTLDVTAAATEADQKVGATTLNTAIQKACGDNKGKFSLAIMHSAVSTNLENLNLVERLKYTDANGIQRELALGTWNGKTVIIDDGMPTATIDDVYTLTADTSLNGAKTYYTRTGSGTTANPYVYTSVDSPDVANIATYYELTSAGYVEYTTFALGNGAIDFEDVGAKVPYEMDRNPAHNGGETTLYSRQRKVFAPYGISMTKKSVAKNSPTDDELKNGINWELVNDGATSKTYINHKAVPIARIVSRG